MPRTRSRIFRRSDSPFWWAVYSSPSGEPVRQSTGCRDRGAAEAWLATREIERVRAQAGVPVARQVSLTVAAAEYIAEREPVWSDGWAAAVEGFFALRAIPFFGENRVVASITRAEIERFRAAQIGAVVKKRKTSNATVNRLMAAFAAFGAWCLVDGRLYHTANPWAKHEPLPEDELPVPDVDDAQVELVLATLDNRKRFRIAWRPIVEFALETGLRKSELGRLRREDVRGRVLFVVSSHARGRTKNRKLRPVPLSLRAVAILEALPKRVDGAIFGKVGDPRRAFKTAAKAAGLERCWLHLFRHLAASRKAELGFGRHELREFGGWSSTRMVDRYTHARMARMLELLDGGAGEKGHGGGTQAVAGNTTGGPEDPNRPR
jgi:integrase